MQSEKKCIGHDSQNENAFSDNKAFLEESIKNIIKKEGYVKHKIYKKTISTDGCNYTSELHEVNIKGETASGVKETNIFVKSLKPMVNTICSITEAYFKEYFMYKELSEILNDIQNEARIPVDEKFNMVKSYDVTNTNAIFLENLSKKGFKILHRMDVIPVKFGELAVKHLAKFHSLFYVLQRKMPDYFNNYLKVWKQPFTFNEEWKQFILKTCILSSNALKGESKNKVKDFIQIIFEKYPLYYQDTSSPGCTICHGDYGLHNILVKDTDGKKAEMVPVDYQFLYYGCPINDLIHLLFINSDQDFRKNHLTDLKNLYYDHLVKFLSYFNLDGSDIYPREEFEKQYKERLDLGLMYVLYGTPFKFSKEDYVLDLSKDDMTKFDFVLDSRYCKRVQETVDDFIQWGYL